MFERAIFDHACKMQSEAFTGQSEFAIKCNQAVFDAACNAAADVQSNATDPAVHVVSSGTGTGKTTFCVSLMAACHSSVSDYSAAYVVATIAEAQRVYDTLAKLLPEEAVTIHTSAHASETAAKQSEEPEVLAHLNAFGTTSIAGLRKSRIVVCTHELWIREGTTDADFGIRKFNAAPRTNVFVDEFPDWTDTHAVVPSDLDELADELERVSGQETAAQLIHTAANTFRVQCGANNRRFDISRLLSSKDLAELSGLDLGSISNARYPEKLQGTLDALKASGRGRGFLWRSKAKSEGDVAGHKTLVTYANRFRAHPGLIFLDATAEHAPQASVFAKTRRYSGPPVDYRNLALTHIEQPKRFDRVSSRVASQSEIKDFVGWVKETVRDHTSKDEAVLIVAPQKVAQVLVEQTVASGRKVHVAHWGMGIGSNEYRECGAVFLFSEYHLPRHAYLSKSLASRNRSATEGDLRQANGAHLTGQFAEDVQGHRLRWFKQMASRGRVRKLDANGTATPMRLYTTMGRALFLESYAELFPGAPQPQRIKTDPDSPATKGKLLADVLLDAMSEKKPITLTAEEIEAGVRIQPKDLKRAFGSKQCKPLHRHGWHWRPGNGRKAKPALNYVPVTIEIPGIGCVTL